MVEEKIATICDICIAAKLPLLVTHNSLEYCRIDESLVSLEGKYRRRTPPDDDDHNYACTYQENTFSNIFKS